MPDAHSANGRKKMKSAQSSPKNCLHAHGKCAGHQAHRCVENKEKVLIGDVHAIAFASSDPHLQNKLQCALKLALQDLDYERGDPDPEDVPGQLPAKLCQHQRL